MAALIFVLCSVSLRNFENQTSLPSSSILSSQTSSLPIQTSPTSSLPFLCSPPFLCHLLSNLLPRPSSTFSLSFSSSPTSSFPFQPPHYPHKKTKPKPNVHSNYLYLRETERTFTARAHRKDEKLGNCCLAIAVMWPPGETEKKKKK